MSGGFRTNFSQSVSNGFQDDCNGVFVEDDCNGVFVDNDMKFAKMRRECARRALFQGAGGGADMGNGYS